jgi:trigger factor
LAELNQELFDKFWCRKCSYTATKWSKKKEDAETQFAAQADQKLLDVTDFLIESTKFDLPAEFLKNGCKQ